VECRVNGRRYYRQSESIEMDAEKSILYINVVVIDASEAIKDRVRTRVEDKRLHVPKRLRRVVTAAATGIAGNVFTLHKIAKKVSKKICHKLPPKMFARGITAVVEEVFREGPYVVFQLEIQRVDLATLTKKQLDKELKAGRDDGDDSSKQKKDDGHTRDKKEKKEGHTKKHIDADTDTRGIDTDFTATTVDATMTIATIQPQHVKHWFLYWLELFIAWFLYWLEQCLICMGASHQRRLEEEVLPELILGKLEIIVGEILAEKIEEKFLDAESNVCSEAAQARYFFDTIKEVRQIDEKDKIKEVRQVDEKKD
jgi:hypothetical protein